MGDELVEVIDHHTKYGARVCIQLAHTSTGWHSSQSVWLGDEGWGSAPSMCRNTYKCRQEAVESELTALESELNKLLLRSYLEDKKKRLCSELIDWIYLQRQPALF